MPEGSQEDASTDPHASTIKLPDVTGHMCYSYANDEVRVQLDVQPGVPLRCANPRTRAMSGGGRRRSLQAVSARQGAVNEPGSSG